MFSLNQKVVYPGYGVAYISRIFEKKFGIQSFQFCELKFLSLDMTVMVPMDKAVEMGIRQLSSISHIDAIFSSVSPRKVDPNELVTVNWNKRSKGYTNRLKSGSLEDTYSIYSDLVALSRTKALSFGEASLLQKTEALLVEEIAAVKNFDQGKAVEFLRSFFTFVSHTAYSNASTTQHIV